MQHQILSIVENNRTDTAKCIFYKKDMINVDLFQFVNPPNSLFIKNSFQNIIVLI